MSLRSKHDAVSFPFPLAARVTPTLPKQNRPVREGTRVASVETGLAAAAAKLAQQVMGGSASEAGDVGHRHIDHGSS